jgi:signal transduction histidine kinase
MAQRKRADLIAVFAGQLVAVRFSLAVTPGPLWKHRVQKAMTKPLAILMCAGLTLAWIALRQLLVPDTLAPFTYVVPLLVCTFLSDVRLLWAMAALFAAAQSVEFHTLVGRGAPLSEAQLLAHVATLFNILVGAGLAHALVNIRARLEQSNQALRVAGDIRRNQAADLERRSEELAECNHELHLRALESEEQLLENQRLQANLKRSEFKYREFFEHLDEIVLVLQPTEPAGDWACVDANATALFTAKVDRQALVGVDLKDLPESLLPLIQRERLATALTTRRTHWYEANAGARQYRQIVFPIGDGQVATAALDVTEHRQIEAELRQQDQQKNDFIATLSHELRHPLMPIRFALELLGRGRTEASHGRQVIERQVTHIERLVDDLLDVSRIASGKLHLRLRKIQLTGIVRLAIESVFPDPDHATHRVTTSVAADIGQFVVDPDRLLQILTNLIGNAARYTPTGGVIVVSARSTESQLIIEVSDNGVGLSARDCERIFDMFSQAHDHEKGLGIGLALVKSLVGVHGGVVSASSGGPGCGTTFHIELPLLRGVEARAPDDRFAPLDEPLSIAPREESVAPYERARAVPGI